MYGDCPSQVTLNHEAIPYRPSKIGAEWEEAAQALAFDQETQGAENKDVECSNLPHTNCSFGWITQTFHCSHWAIHPIDTSPVEPSLISVMPCVLGVPAVERNAHDITKNRSNESIGPIRSEKASMAAIMEQHEHA